RRLPPLPPFPPRRSSALSPLPNLLYPHRLFLLAQKKPFPYKAGGSRLPPHRPDAQIAQLVEQRIENPRVAGSIPALGTTFLPDRSEEHTSELQSRENLVC